MFKAFSIIALTLSLWGGVQAAPDAPVAVVPAEPANNALNVALKPVLKWRKLSDAVSYQVQVSATAGFTAPVLDYPSVTDTASPVAAALDVGKPYFWRVRARNVGGEGPWSAVWGFTTVPAIPAVPAALTPADDAVQLPLPAVFAWHKADRAASYDMEISSAADFKTLVFDSVLKGDTSFTGPKILEYGKTYYWHVRARNAGGASAYTATRNFSTLEKPPVPALALPAADAADLPVRLGLFWRKTARAAAYRLEVSAVPTFATTVLVDSGLTDTTKAIGPLDNKTAYYWRVRAKNAAGVSEFSPARKFTTILLLVPPAPILASPGDAAAEVATSPMLKWHPSLRAAAYRLQVSLSPTFATTVFDNAAIADTAKAIGPLANNGTFYWRVAAGNAAGSGAFSEIRSFSTKEGSAAVPVQVSPADNAANSPQVQTFIWKASRFAATYRLQISLKADFSTRVLDDSDEADTTLEAGPLANGETFYWRVRAQNGSGNSEYSPTRKFTVIIQVPGACALISPADNAADQKRTLSFKWAGASRAAGYRFQLSTTATFSTSAIDDSGLTDTTRSVANLGANTSLFWRVRAKNAGGVGAWSEIRSFRTEPGVGLAGPGSSHPEGFAVLSGRSPSEGTLLEFTLKHEGLVRVILTNPINGRSSELVNREFRAGTYRVPVGSLGRSRGVYFLSMTAGEFRQTRKAFLP